MPYSHISPLEISVMYIDLGNKLGFYSIYPGADPVICLNSQLLDNKEELKNIVYNQLFQFHESISHDNWQRGFPLVQYFEDLMPIEISEKDIDGIIFLGRAIARRSQGPCAACEARVLGYRIIGREAG